jgi:hypothetical protein
VADREIENQDPPLRRNRWFDAVATVAVVAGIPLLSLLGSAFNSRQAALERNLETYATANQKQHEQMWDRMGGLETFLCGKFNTWSKCK